MYTLHMIEMLIKIIKRMVGLLLAKSRVSRSRQWAALATKDYLYVLDLQGQCQVQGYQVIALVPGQPVAIPPNVKSLTLSAADCLEHSFTLKADSTADSVTDQVMAAALQQLPGTLDQFVIDYTTVAAQQVRWVAATTAQVAAQQQQWPQAVILEPRADAHARALGLLSGNTDCVVVLEINRGQVEISWHWQQRILHALAADISDDMVSEVAALLSQHAVEQPITQILICGEMATTALAASLQRALTVAVVVADISKHFTYAADIDPAQLHQMPFFTLAGLALRNTVTAPINLLPWRKKLLQQQRYRFLRQVGVIGILVAAVLLGVHQHYQHLITHQQEVKQQLQQQLQQLQPTVARVKALQATQSNINNNLAWLQQLQWQRDRWAVLLALLGRTMPDSLGLLSLTAQDQQIVITGVTQDSTALQQWLTQLQSVPLFSAVQLTATTPQQFTLSLTWAG